MNEKKKRYDWCANYTCFRSHPIDVPRAQTVFLENGKKIISIYYLLEGN